MTGFAHFNEAYKTLFGAIMGFAGSGIAALLTLHSKLISQQLGMYQISLGGFAASIFFALCSLYWGLLHHAKEGEGGNCLDYRQINRRKLFAISISLGSFFLGFFTFFYLAITL